MQRLIVLLAVTAALVAGACSNGDDEVEATGEVTATAEPTAEATATASATPEDPEDTESATPTPEIDMDSPAFTDESTISTVGLDEVFFGMTAEDAAVAAGTAWETDTEPNPECWFATPINGPEGVQLMIWESTVERIDVETELITTRSGAGVGSTAEELGVLFGDRLTEDGPARLVFVPADEEDAEFRIVFDMADDVVVAYRAGRLPMVELLGCP